MEVLGKQTVTRYFVAYSDEEVEALRAVGWLPPTSANHLWLTWDEIKRTMERLGAVDVPDIIRRAIESAAPLVADRPAMEGWVTVHVLYQLPFCEFSSDPPLLWGGDKWVRVEDVGPAKQAEVEEMARHRICPECWSRALNREFLQEIGYRCRDT